MLSGDSNFKVFIFVNFCVFNFIFLYIKSFWGHSMKFFLLKNVYQDFLTPKKALLMSQSEHEVETNSMSEAETDRLQK